MNFHLQKNRRADFRADIADRARCKLPVIEAEFDCAARIWIQNQHTCRRIDSPVNHIGNFVLLNLSCRLAALIINDGAFTQSDTVHFIKNVRMSCLRKHKNTSMCFDSRNQVFVLFRDIQNFDVLKIHVCMIRKILQP